MYICIYRQTKFFQGFSIRNPLSSVGSILTEIVLLFADSDLPIDFYISSILLRITIRVSFFQGFPRRFSIIKRGFWILCDQFPQKSGFCFLFCLEFCFVYFSLLKLFYAKMWFIWGFLKFFILLDFVTKLILKSQRNLPENINKQAIQETAIPMKNASKILNRRNVQKI